MRTKRILEAMFVEAGAADANELPPELEARAVSRLTWLVLGIGTFFVASVPLRWITWGKGDGTLLTYTTILAGLFAGLSFLTFALLRFGRLEPRTVLKAGLAYEIALCFALAFVEQVLVGFTAMPFRLSVVVVVLLTFPLVVPSPPRWRLIATGLGALSQPVALLAVGSLAGSVRPWDIAATSLPTLMVAALAAWLGQVVHRLRVDVGRARAFGQYELLSKLGEGGMGEVWEARHAKLLRPAVIKLIRPETAGLYGDAAKARFRREAQATGALRSPHTVELYDFGTTEDGTLYYAMEMLEGIDLETFVLRFGSMAPERVLHVLDQAARSLAEAHELGLVHRDIKPANVYLCRVATELDFVKVLDFGLVKPRYVAEESPVSVAGAVSGTPGYVAPEHASGRPYDGRADLYALGCVAYYLLTGQRVFVRRTKLELMSAHLSLDPTPPSLRVPGLVVPPSLDALIMALLARDPGQRPQTAWELVEQVAAIRDEAPRWDAARAREWWRAHLPELAAPRDQLVL